MKKIKKIIQFLGYTVLFAGFIVALVAARFDKKKKAVTQVTIKDDTSIGFLDQEDILAVTVPYLDTLNSNVLADINLLEIEQKISENTYVNTCDVYVDNRGILTINVSQKRPLYRVINNSGVSYYLDKNLNRIPLSNKFTANVPVATGFIDFKIDSLGKGQGKAIIELTKLFEFIEQDKFLSSLISQAVVNRSGDIELMPRTGYHSILVGDAENLEDKFERLKIFYKEGLNRTGWDKYDVVNLKYNGQVIAKYKNDG